MKLAVWTEKQSGLKQFTPRDRFVVVKMVNMSSNTTKAVVVAAVVVVGILVVYKLRCRSSGGRGGKPT